MFKFKKFQLEDYARGALHDGLVLGHDTGGGIMPRPGLCRVEAQEPWFCWDNLKSHAA